MDEEFGGVGGLVESKADPFRESIESSSLFYDRSHSLSLSLLQTFHDNGSFDSPKLPPWFAKIYDYDSR